MRLWLLSLGLLGSLSAQAAGSVWALRGGHNTVYLAGSVHVLPDTERSLPPAFDRAYAEAEALVMEIDLDDVDELATQRWVLEHGTFAGDTTLRMTLGEQRHARLAAEAGRLGLPLEGLQEFEPWTVALTLVQLELQRLGMNPEHGVEKQLQRRAGQDHKEILGLETTEQQLGILDGLSYEEQARFLDLTISEAESMPGEVEALLDAWRRGDSRALERLLLAEYGSFPTLYRRLVTERNRSWIPRIRELLHDRRDYLVVVGALHLVGDQGVLRLLERAGLDPQPVP